ELVGSDSRARDGRIGILPIAEQQDDLRRRIARKRGGQAEHVVDAPRALRGPREDDASADRTQDSRESRSQTWRGPLQEERIERMAKDRARGRRKAGSRRPVPIAVPQEPEMVHKSRRVRPGTEEPRPVHRDVVPIVRDFGGQGRIEKSSRQLPRVVEGPEKDSNYPSSKRPLGLSTARREE